MTDNNDIKEIRDLLERWYAGETSAAEEARLGDLLVSGTDLPEDLKAEVRLFAEFSLDEDELAEIPDVYEKRITAALEREMAAGTGKRILPAAHGWRRLRWAAVAAVACLAGLVFVFRENGSSVNSVGDVLTAREEQIRQTVRDTLLNVGTPQFAKAAVPVAGSRASGPDIKTRPKDVIPDSRKNRGKETSVYMIEAGENLYMPEYYRVIADAEDADSIVNSVFSQFESRLAMESSKLSNLELDYELEMVKAQNINNFIYMDDTYEKIPI